MRNDPNAKPKPHRAYSPATAVFASPDGRSREGRYVRRFRADLIRYVGGNPDRVQNALIERAAWTSLRLTNLEARLADGQEVNEADYLAWTNALMFALARLGDAPRPDPSTAKKWQPGPPPAQETAPLPGSSRQDRVHIKLELQILCSHVSEKAIDDVVKQVVRLEHIARHRRRAARHAVVDARTYATMTARLDSVLDTFGRFALDNTLFERTVKRHKVDSVEALADSLALYPEETAP